MNVNDFKSNLKKGGARPTLFKASFYADGIGSNLEFLLKATSLPASTLGAIEVPYMGRKIKVAGDRTFAEWTVTIINDEDFGVRDALESWSNSISTHVGNVETVDLSSYKKSGKVEQLGKDGKVIKTYRFEGVWPSEIAAIELAWDSNDAIEDFGVTFQVDWWTSNTTDS